jgi:hypothetical protein
MRNLVSTNSRLCNICIYCNFRSVFTWFLITFREQHSHFNPNRWDVARLSACALKMWFSHIWDCRLIMQLSKCVPTIYLRKFIGLCAEHNAEATFQDALAVFNGVLRISVVIESDRYTVSMGLLSDLSYAFTSNQISGIFRWVFHVSSINFVWGGGTCLFTAFGARYLAMSVSTSETYLKWATPMMRAMNWEAAYAWMRNVIQTTLQGLQ